MIIIPREKPAIENLNSYYLDIEKLIEHYQGDLGAGVVHFVSSVAEAVLFFDEAQLVNGHYEDKKQAFDGQAAIDRIMNLSVKNNFSVSVFRVIPERVYFWANLSNSKVLYSDLSSEFTDLEALIKKLGGEKFTGYIDVQLTGEGEGGLLFFFNGEIIGGSSGEADGEIDRSDAYRDGLIQRSRQSGGKFSVMTIFMEAANNVAVSSVKKHPQKGPKNTAAGEKESTKTDVDSARVIEMLRCLLVTMEKIVRSNKKIRTDFETLLNKKFVEKADRYDFLDPFAAEFRYSGEKITYNGNVSSKLLVKAIVECTAEVATTLGIMNELRLQLNPWRKSFTDEVIAFDIRL